MARRAWTRREWIGGTVAASAAWGVARSARAVDYDKPVPGSDRMTAYQAGSEVIVRWRNATLAAYRAHPSQKYPYFYPLAGPITGAPLTTESSLPYPHHRGLWLGCEPLNGGDYWGDNALAKGQIRSLELKLGPATPTSAVIADRCRWERPGPRAPGGPEDVHPPRARREDPPARRRPDALGAGAREHLQGEALVLRPAMRPDLAPMYGGVLMNSEGGVGAEGTYGKAASWCGYHGRRAGRPDVVEGIAILDHPENPWSPCPWLTRDYGHLSPSPFNFIKQPWVLPAGASVRLRYRVVLHAGDPKEAGLDAIYKQWVNG